MIQLIGLILLYTTSVNALDIKTVSLGFQHSCLITKSGDIWCWGGNEFGQMGNATSTKSYLEPQLVYKAHNRPKAVSIALGSRHCCALFENEKIKCWGRNDGGQTGNGSTNDKIGFNETIASLPYVNLGKNFFVTKLEAGSNHTCALSTDNRLKCWGTNSQANLGLEHMTNIGQFPDQMGENLPVVQIPGVIRDFCASRATCVALEDGTARCWGRFDSIGMGLDFGFWGGKPAQMGNNLLPIPLGKWQTVKKVSCGSYHNCALLENNRIKCWGLNHLGQSGSGHVQPQGIGTTLEMGDNLPTVPIDSKSKVVKLTSGGGHNCVLFENGRAKCWGWNGWGQLGIGSIISIGDHPNEVEALPWLPFGQGAFVTDLFTGFQHNCVLLSSGELKCWGHNRFGQLGLGHTDFLGNGPNEMGDNLVPLKFVAPVERASLRGPSAIIANKARPSSSR